jgi:MscS family membrane protein
VPENPGADRLTVQPVRNEFDSLVGNVSLVRNGSRWQFSRETLADLDAIHTAVFRARSGEGTSGEVAKDVVAPDGLKSPRDTMRTFLTAMNEDRPGEAAAALDLRQINSVIRDEEGPRLAALLLAILNRTKSRSSTARTRSGQRVKRWAVLSWPARRMVAGGLPPPRSRNSMRFGRR